MELSGNDLTGSIPPELGGLASLESLSLGGNDLTGSIPPELGGLVSLESLRIGGNDLDGSIPPELGELTGLKVLRLQNNDLTGSIPPELGDLSLLTELWVHRNRLSGPLPLSLARLAALQSLRYNATGLCVPADESFGAWLNGIRDHRGTGAACTPGQVTGVTVTEQVRQLAVSWNAVTGADRYKVQWKSATQSYDASREAAVTGTSHTIPNLTAGMEYTVRVIATRKDAADNPPSAEVTGTPMEVGPNRPPAPTVSNQTATVGQPFSYQFDAVTDPDGDPVTYVARLPRNTPLPAWLSFDATSRTFSGTPGADDVGEITINVIAFDDAFNFKHVVVHPDRRRGQQRAGVLRGNGRDAQLPREHGAPGRTSAPRWRPTDAEWRRAHLHAGAGRTRRRSKS